jgi:hypothetical protein
MTPLQKLKKETDDTICEMTEEFMQVAFQLKNEAVLNFIYGILVGALGMAIILGTCYFASGNKLWI